VSSDQPPTAPAEFPLPGGQADARLTLHPLLCAEISAPPNWFVRKPGPVEALKAFGVGVPARDLIPVPIPAYLLEHPSAGPVLVDTGMHESCISGGGRERSRNLGPIGRLMSRRLSVTPEQTAAAQLRAHGLQPTDIRLIVMTHLHYDHASALRDFPNATVLVDAREWAAAWARDALMNGYSKAQLDPRPRYRTIDFTAPPSVASGPFERTIDVFGDGSLTLASTPGHTVGHLSLIARLDGREALLAADAAYTIGTIRGEERPWLIGDRKAFEHSVSQLRAYDREHPDAVVIPGHEMASWKAACEQLAGR
jgi:N-acyl homoserine lactone hydrolase